MRKPFLAGNWKMNNLINESESLTKGLLENLQGINDKDILVCPPFTSIAKVKEIISDANIKLGAQNCAYADKGAYTGEISPDMLLDAGCEYVILGHSERRAYYGETDEIINKKIHLALQKGLKVIFCIGEVLYQRQSHKTFDVVKTQLTGGLKDIDLTNVTIAYEPVWAIGTGQTATPEQAEEVHAFIRNLISELYNSEIADKTRILYGGSVNPGNIKGLMACPNVDGGLVGGASLKVSDFTDLVRFA
ncbi:triose-phosphate isomerase [bacterium]